MTTQAHESQGAVEALHELCAVLRSKDVKAHIVAPVRADGLAFGAEWEGHASNSPGRCVTALRPRHYHEDLKAAAETARERILVSRSRDLRDSA
jgi:hypothetical protein